MVNRVLLGKFPDGINKYGLRISKSGVDVHDVNAVGYNENLVFSSDWPALLPIWAQGTMSISGSSVTAYYNDIGYIPFCAAFVDAGLGWQVYQTAQDYLSKNKAVTAVTNVDMSPVYEYAFEGNTYANIQVRAFSDHISIYSNVSISAYWMVYRARAF